MSSIFYALSSGCAPRTIQKPLNRETLSIFLAIPSVLALEPKNTILLPDVFLREMCCCRMKSRDFFGFGYGSPSLLRVATLLRKRRQPYLEPSRSQYPPCFVLVRLIPPRSCHLLVAEHKLFSIISFTVLSDTSLLIPFPAGWHHLTSFGGVESI